jgi:nucleotide-binding universal stress UspA family protein
VEVPEKPVRFVACMLLPAAPWAQCTGTSACQHWVALAGRLGGWAPRAVARCNILLARPACSLLHPRDSSLWDDQLWLLHVAKTKEKERWDLGGPVMPDVATATEGYNVIVAELEVGGGRDSPLPSSPALACLSRAPPAPGTPLRCIPPQGEPTQVLIEHANKEGFDMLVLGAWRHVGLAPGSRSPTWQATGSTQQHAVPSQMLPSLAATPATHPRAPPARAPAQQRSAHQSGAVPAPHPTFTARCAHAPLLHLP